MDYVWVDGAIVVPVSALVRAAQILDIAVDTGSRITCTARSLTGSDRG
jgi:hypothetical protein